MFGCGILRLEECSGLDCLDPCSPQPQPDSVPDTKTRTGTLNHMKQNVFSNEISNTYKKNKLPKNSDLKHKNIGDSNETSDLRSNQIIQNQQTNKELYARKLTCVPDSVPIKKCVSTLCLATKQWPKFRFRRMDDHCRL